MPRFDLRLAAHISDGARHLQERGMAGSRQAEVLHGTFQATQAGSVRRAVTLHRRIVQLGVEGPLALCLQLSSPHDASGDLRAGFTATTRLAQALELYARNVYMQVQTIEQRTRNPGAIPLHLISSAVTSIVRVAEIATRTRVHRRDQLEARREFRLAGRT